MRTETNNFDLTPDQATVFLVDDDRSYLKALSRLLSASGFRVAVLESAEQMLKSLTPETNGCLVTDLMMPGMDGMALQEAFRMRDNPLPIVFLTGHGDIPTSVQAMRQGAEDFLTKNATKEELIDAVRRALARNAHERAEKARSRELKRKLEVLTDREREVLRKVVEGKLNKQIAADLGIHERTVKLHRTSITGKLGVRSVAELTKLTQEARFE